MAEQAVRVHVGGKPVKQMVRGSAFPLGASVFVHELGCNGGCSPVELVFPPRRRGRRRRRRIDLEHAWNFLIETTIEISFIYILRF